MGTSETEVSTPLLTWSLHGSATHMTNPLSSETMTNEEAIKFIINEYDFDAKSVVLARMFAMEDIIEYDVEEWVKMPVSAGLAEFVEHCRHANEMVIPKYTNRVSYNSIEMEASLQDITSKMEEVMLAMQVYADIQEKIREKFAET